MNEDGSRLTEEGAKTDLAELHCEQPEQDSVAESIFQASGEQKGISNPTQHLNIL